LKAAWRSLFFSKAIRTAVPELSGALSRCAALASAVAASAAYWLTGFYGISETAAIGVACLKYYLV
jgi:hypothetical protein